MLTILQQKLHAVPPLTRAQVVLYCLGSMEWLQDTISHILYREEPNLSRVSLHLTFKLALGPVISKFLLNSEGAEMKRKRQNKGKGVHSPHLLKYCVTFTFMNFRIQVLPKVQKSFKEPNLSKNYLPIYLCDSSESSDSSDSCDPKNFFNKNFF